MNILLIDDDEDTAFLMGVLFRKSNIVEKYFIKSTGKTALDLLQHYVGAPDCIFVDLKMPDMNGFEFVEEYERLFIDRFPRTRIYVLSASALLSDQQRASSYCTVEEFIMKPLSKQKLYEIKETLSKNRLAE